MIQLFLFFGKVAAFCLVAVSCLTPAQYIIRQHIEEATHYDGPRCPMYPSCATYGQKAIQEHGWLGFLLTVDRLVYRETGELYAKYSMIHFSDSNWPRYYDPLEDSLGESNPTLFSTDINVLSREEY
ncbi:MAG: membrane protein insertion efficiency factor YidD [Leptonema sp. (in: Bacteria)]|nr:membrane protein insertion efficiency factor YidD [Leptonema sp. (in: bacteria)]